MAACGAARRSGGKGGRRKKRTRMARKRRRGSRREIRSTRNWVSSPPTASLESIRGKQKISHHGRRRYAWVHYTPLTIEAPYLVSAYTAVEDHLCSYSNVLRFLLCFVWILPCSGRCPRLLWPSPPRRCKETSSDTDTSTMSTPAVIKEKTNWYTRWNDSGSIQEFR